MDEERLTDEATGLPPLEEADPEASMVVLAWAASEGIVAGASPEPQAVRWLHVRGLALQEDGTGAQWTQLHFAVPVEHALDVAAALAKGTTEDLDV
jgi:hypothetical protein